MRVFVIWLISSFVSITTWAGIAVTNTRIIYPANAKSVNVQLNNLLDKPALAQVWIDSGNPSEVPAAKDNPFLVSPPVSRLNAQANQIVRIMFKPNMQMAQDRESLYWFNLLDVPPLSKSEESKNVLQFSIRSRLKLFYRPENLSMSQAQAFKSLTFKQNTAKKSIEIENPSPYYITFNRLDFKTNQNETVSYTADLMVAPLSKKEVEFDRFKTPMINVNYEVINDLGGYVQHEAKIY